MGIYGIAVLSFFFQAVFGNFDLMCGHFAGVRSTFGRFQHIFQKILNIHDLVVGH